MLRNHEFFENSLFYFRPFVVDKTEVHSVPQSPVVVDDILAKQTFPNGADLHHRFLRL